MIPPKGGEKTYAPTASQSSLIPRLVSNSLTPSRRASAVGNEPGRGGCHPRWGWGCCRGGGVCVAGAAKGDQVRSVEGRGEVVGERAVSGGEDW